MNTAQRHVLVRGLLLSGVVIGLLGVNWLTDGDWSNDGRGAHLLILGAAAIIAGLFIRAGAPPTSPTEDVASPVRARSSAPPIAGSPRGRPASSGVDDMKCRPNNEDGALEAQAATSTTQVGPRLVRCPSCRGHRRDGCPTCLGSGWIEAA